MRIWFCLKSKNGFNSNSNNIYFVQPTGFTPVHSEPFMFQYMHSSHLYLEDVLSVFRTCSRHLRTCSRQIVLVLGSSRLFSAIRSSACAHRLCDRLHMENIQVQRPAPIGWRLYTTHMHQITLPIMKDDHMQLSKETLVGVNRTLHV